MNQTLPMHWYRMESFNSLSPAKVVWCSNTQTCHFFLSQKPTEIVITTEVYKITQYSHFVHNKGSWRRNCSTDQCPSASHIRQWFTCIFDECCVRMFLSRTSVIFNNMKFNIMWNLVLFVKVAGQPCCSHIIHLWYFW